MPANKVTLIGFMGAGKSSISKLLAEQLGYTPLDMDQLLLEKSGYPNIREIFTLRGEPHFRQIESEIAASLRDAKRVVIATGGGVVGSEQNMTHLKHNAVTIFLQTSLETIRHRVSNLENRPLFKDGESAKQLFIRRQELYNLYADIIVSTENRDPAQVTHEILSQI
jgi:shikimate kinase